MDSAAELKALLRREITASLHRGLWRFDYGLFTDWRIHPSTLEPRQAEWSELAADLLLEAPTGGLVGVQEYGDTRWIRSISEALDQRGVELPATEVNLWADDTWGVPFRGYPPGAKVTIFCTIHTLGAQLELVRSIAEGNGLTVHRAVALIDRHPVRTFDVDGIPFSSVLHLPLPLYRDPGDIPTVSSRERRYRFWYGVEGLVS